MIVTEEGLREQLRHPRQGASVSVPAGATLSPAARDFVAQWRLDIQETNPTDRPQPAHGAHTGTSWNRPSAFTFDPETRPVCTSCGSEVSDKPEGMTQLNACHLAPKTHPRIRLRGRLDSLQALTLVIAAKARDVGDRQTAARLDTLAAYLRELLAAEYQEREAAPLELDGLDAAAIRRATHDPRSTLGVDHLAPESTDPGTLLECNWLRTQVREVELVAVETFPDPHDPYGYSLVHALNRLSSAVYYVALAQAAGVGPREVTS